MFIVLTTDLYTKITVDIFYKKMKIIVKKMIIKVEYATRVT